MFRTGYCCINLTLNDKFKTMQLSWANRNEKSCVTNKWNQVVQHNFELLTKIINWNIANNVYLYRISSSLVPFADHKDWGHLWQSFRLADETAALLNPTRQIIKRYIALGGRFTIHPGQFCSIGSINSAVRKSSVEHLEYHGELLDLLGLPKSYDCPINIHASNGRKDPKIITNNIKNSLLLLSDSVSKRIVFENEQNGHWNPQNLRKAFPNVPITFDYHHFRINDGGLPLDEAERLTSESWPNNDPVQHYSEGRAHVNDPAHSDYVERLPVSDYDIEVEAKAKDLAIKDFLPNRNKYIEGVLY